jgi:hypothetical protein
MQPRVSTGVNGHLQIAGDEIPFSAYIWQAAVTTLSMWTGGSSPFPDVLTCRQQALALTVRGFWASDLNPNALLRNGNEVSDVIVFIDDMVSAACDYAIITNFRTSVSTDGASVFTLTLLSSWQYGDFGE